MSRLTPASAAGAALGHPLRVALLGLVREHGTLTSTQAAWLLDRSSGLCSFHLRQLARYGYLEEVPTARGRVRPWRLRTTEHPGQDEEFGALARDLEDEGYRRWLAGRPRAPLAWQRDEVFSTVLRLSPAEMTGAATEIRAVLDRYGRREVRGRRPVAAVVRLFPLLPADPPAGPEAAAGG